MDRKNVEAIYPLTPMQEAFLLHSVRRGSHDAGFIVMQGDLCGRLDEAAFRKAWEHVLKRHTVLRTAVHWEALEQPLQVVFKEVDLSCETHDWRTVSVPAQQTRLDAFLRDNQKRGLDLRQAPVMRLALFRLAEDRWHFVWSTHHVLLDGWSGALVLQDVLQMHDAFRGGADAMLPASVPFGDYATWLRKQDQGPAAAYWQDLLRDAPAPVPLGATKAGGGSEHLAYRLAPDDANVLYAFVRKHRLTLSALMQGTWALWLHGYTGVADLLFGSTVSGRTAPVPGIEAMVGLFINALPVRVTIDPRAPVLDLFSTLAAQQARSSRHAHVSGAQLHAWSGVPVHQRLFESLLVVENYPWQPDRFELEIAHFQGGFTSAYPLTLAVVPDHDLTLRMVFDQARFDTAFAEGALYDLGNLLRAIMADIDYAVTVADVVGAAGVQANAAADGRAAVVHAVNGRALSHETIPPQTALEFQLVAIWEEVLGIRPIGIRDDFFALGVPSLAAASLLNRIGQVSGRKLPLSLLFRCPTVEALARVLRDEGWTPPWSALVPITTTGTKPPLFCAHSWDGEVFVYQHLARCLAPDQPVYGIQTPGLEKGQPEFERLAELTAHYVSEIQALQSTGPYLILGYCFGVLVAFEIAQQLQAQGHNDTWLFVVENGPAGHDPRIAKSRQRRPVLPSLARLVTHWRQGDLVERFRARLRPPSGRFEQSVSEEVRIPMGSQSWEQFQAFFRVHEAMMHRYVAQPYPGAITLFRSEEFAARPAKDWHLKAWRELAEGGFASHVIPGPHLAILKAPYVQILAERLQSSIKEALATDVR